ncbi:DNA polymerase III subunit beta [Fusobacterium pseudoperiodonticum]|uniref:DNA polymerase III subunit beta n=2 Tax=Fusobacterium TaxID=848 RepID=A0A2G9E9B6_9FUSO|nr:MULTISPECIES: DNA polymerase III subunit beta [Fusobacterium]ATV60198.1 DNA polymerase III subunit beta [Fusobacterium pseudoperiodonticum]ATV66164.1 DNA polymerase III subunit beta [Fusobacterium pseudoperiodonticum]EKA94389.1 DNA polymerase III, beta subunit [Fusobacterium periodonticum D10]PIM77475.1 DNA polymerase III subunit beta [Fusobacterium pseudoperiodonticum]
MHIKVNRQNFLTAVRIVEKSIKDNKIKPILSCVYAKVKDNKVYFTGTNLDTTIKTSIDVNEVIREGEVAFSPSIIDEYLKEIKDEFVVLRVENGNILFIETEDSTTEYDVFTTEDYPNTFENINLNENNFKFEMPSQELVEIFEKVLFSADTPDNIAMNCIRIESNNKTLNFVSTNTYRLTYLKKDVEKEINDFAVSVPADTISSIVKIVKGLDNELIKIYKEDAHLYFKYKETTIITKLIELRFPNYADILSNITYDKKLSINNETFTNLLKRVLIFSRSNMESKYSSTYQFKHGVNGESKLIISALNDIARINEELNISFEGEDLKISLNSKYLLEFIQNIPKEKELVLEFMYANSAVKVYEKDNENYIYILMPLALRD